MSYAFRCEVCKEHPLWTVERYGDAVVSWACATDLSEVCLRLQRTKHTELSVTMYLGPVMELKEESHETVNTTDV